MLTENGALRQSKRSKSVRPKAAGKAVLKPQPKTRGVTAWRLGPELRDSVAYRCGRCHGVHAAEDPTLTGTSTVVTSSCPEAFGRPGYVNLRIVEDEVPPGIKAIFVNRVPLADIASAFEAVDSDADCYPVTANSVRSFTHSAAWAPKDGVMPRALQVLREHGFGDEAKALRAVIGNWLHKPGWQLLGSDRWCRDIAPVVRRRLKAALRAAWVAGNRR